MKSNLAKIPSVNLLLENLKPYLKKFDHHYLKNIIEEKISIIKNNPKRYKLDSLNRDEIAISIQQSVIDEVENLLSPVLQQVINGTGIILHTGLGRAPLGTDIFQSLSSVSQYTNLEINLNTGKRGQRMDHIVPLLKLLTGTEDAVITNNNAAAVVLCLNSIAKRKEVIISRGELVEIGGSFRMPDVMKSSGAKMIEVGSTNKTHLQDYEQAINNKTAAIMIVHPSNYEIMGFTEKPEIKDIVKLAQFKNIPVIYDLGSGALIDMRQFNLYNEPIVSEMVKLGIELISFSGDKLLGGPQAGIIVGKQQYLKKLKQNHLLRALRCDKITISLLTKTLQTFIHNESLPNNNLTYHFFRRNKELLTNIGNDIINKLNPEKRKHIKLIDSEGRIGSGAYPTFPIESISLQINTSGKSAESIARKFRQNQTPILGYIESNIFRLNLLAINENEINIISDAINSII